jgi:hypothetical protein
MERFVEDLDGGVEDVDQRPEDDIVRLNNN